MWRWSLSGSFASDFLAGPVTNLRFNESPVVMLQNTEGMTPAVPAGRMVVPAIKSREFTFTSKSDAV